MGRLLKFRAWNKGLKKMQGVLDIHLDPEFGGVSVWGKACIDHDTGDHDADKDFWHWEDIETVEFTGLLDKNGKEIFEDDIVELLFLHPVKGPYKRKARVLFADFRWWFQMLEPVGARVEMIWLESNWQRKCEVIGNIYEHPELIDKKAKEDNG